MAENDTARFRLRLRGTPQLTAPSGADVTPRLRKAQALLAVLALAEGAPVSRHRLQKLLWSDRMQAQGRDSLKKALSEIRRAFAEAGAQNPLETDGGPVSLRLTRIDVDMLSDCSDTDTLQRPPLLEGHGIADPNFVAWVADMRRRQAPARMATPLLPAHRSARRRLTIGVMPSSVLAERDIDLQLAQLLRQGLSRALRQSGVFEIYDATGTCGHEADLTLSTTLAVFGGATMLEARLATTHDRHELWSTSETLDMTAIDPRRISVLVQVMADQISQKVRVAGDLGGERGLVTRSVLSAIEQLFRLSDQDIASADRALSQAVDAMPSSPILAWYAYLTAFQVEKGGRREETIDKADRLAAQAMEADPTNPLTRALVSHVYSFVLRDLDRAAEILEPVTGLAGTNVMLADAIGLLHYYRGTYDRAEAHARLTCELGPWSRFRYAFTTSLAMSQLMRGDYDNAISSSRRALAQHPLRTTHVYEPTLRTLASALALSGQRDPARDALTRLDRQTGTRTIERLTSPDQSPFPNAETFKIVKSSLEQLHAS